MTNSKSLIGFRRFFAAVAIISLFALAAACGSGGSGENIDSTPNSSGSAGKVEAPTFAAETFRHGTFDLAAYEGTPVVVNFWFPSCPPCTAEMPDLQAAYEKYGDRVEFVGVQQLGLDTPEDGREFIDEVGVTYPNFADQDSRVQFEYGVLNYPTTVFLDSDHNINRTWQGLISSENLEEQIEALLEA